MKRLVTMAVAALVATAGLVLVQGSAASAADPLPAGYGCSQHWHTIQAGQTGAGVVPQGAGIFALGAANQPSSYVLFCQRADWGDTYEIYSNQTANLWTLTGDGSSNLADPLNALESHFGTFAGLFVVSAYDANFYSIKTWGSSRYVYYDANRSYLLYADRTWRGGDSLFTISHAGGLMS